MELIIISASKELYTTVKLQFEFHTCGLQVNVGEVLVALQFNFIKDVHLLLCRERPIKLHLLNKIRSVTVCHM